MTNDDKPGENFGCEHCWPEAADAAWEARGTFSHVGELIDESHFHVMILQCPRCFQRFLSVFTEIIDWEEGDDPQDWTLLPLTEAEATDVLQQRESLTESMLQALGSGRRCLRRAHPKGRAQDIFWGRGVWVGMHD